MGGIGDCWEWVEKLDFRLKLVGFRGGMEFFGVLRLRQPQSARLTSLRMTNILGCGGLLRD